MHRTGTGPPLLAVHGSTADHTRWTPVREPLGDRYTLYLLDRRGRAGSTNESDGPYALAREVEDVSAVLDAIGEPTFYLGHSYGALIGLDALRSCTEISKALLYEPPFDTPAHAMLPATFLPRFSELLADGERERALELFYREVVEIDPAPLRDLPIWQARLAAVHTLEREGRIGVKFACDADLFAGVEVPVRVLLGADSPPGFAAAGAAIKRALPHAELVTLPGQGHGMIDADPGGFVDQVVDFFG